MFGRIKRAIGSVFAGIAKGMMKIGKAGEKLYTYARKPHRAYAKQKMKEASGKEQTEALKFLRDAGVTEEELKIGTEKL
jgi:hypothetical protein